MHVFEVEHINRLKATVFKSIIIYFNQFGDWYNLIGIINKKYFKLDYI